MLNLRLSKDSQKFLDMLPPKQFRQIVRKIFALLEYPLSNDSIELQGFPLRRCDIGEYRIIYDIQGDTLRVVVVGKRNDDEVYRRLSR